MVYCHHVLTSLQARTLYEKRTGRPAGEKMLSQHWFRTFKARYDGEIAALTDLDPIGPAV